MPSPFRKDQLSPAMVRRYGLDRTPWGTYALVLGLAIAFAATLGWVTVSVQTGVKVRVIAWDDSAPDHVTLQYEVQRERGAALECALRAQDRTHVDVGYAIAQLPAGADSVQASYSLATLAPAFTVEVLGCAPTRQLRVPDPAFPPSVAAPSQPYAP